MGVSVSFLVVMIKYPDNSNLGKEDFTVAHSSSVRQYTKEGINSSRHLTWMIMLVLQSASGE